MRLTSSGPPSAMGARVGMGGVLALCVAPALTGHAIASAAYPALAVVADAVHVAAGGVWLGTLSLLLVVGMPVTAELPRADRARRVARLVGAFSPLALAGAATVFLTGVVAAYLRLDAVSALWRTPYGRVLAGKVSCFLLIVAAGAYNWRRATARVTTTERGVDDLERSVAAELTFGAVLLVLTAILVAMAPPADA